MWAADMTNGCVSMNYEKCLEYESVPQKLGSRLGVGAGLLSD